MARFRFSLQSLLNIKEKLESQLQMEYAAAVLARDLNLEEIKMVGEQILEQNQIFLEKQEQSFVLRDLILIQNQISYFKDLEMNLRLRQEELEEKLSDCRQRLTKAMQERKTYEILREKAKELHLEEEKKAELKMVDEQASFKYSKKRRG